MPSTGACRAFSGEGMAGRLGCVFACAEQPGMLPRYNQTPAQSSALIAPWAVTAKNSVPMPGGTCALA
jgi:hypothetical protein